MSRRIRNLRLAQPFQQRRCGQVVQGVFVDLGNSGSQVGTNEEFPPLDFGLDDDEAKIRFGVHVTSHLFDQLDLLLDAVGGAFD